MTPEAATELMVALGGKSIGQFGTWLRGPCVLARWRHKSGKDSNPSFGLYVEDGSPSRFHCFTCESGSMSKLLQLLEMHLQSNPKGWVGDLSKAREIIENAELELPTLPAYAEFNTVKKKQFEELPQYLLETFTPALNHQRAQKYCHHRGFSATEVLKNDMRYDEERDMLVFPYWDVFGRFAGMRGRAIVLPGEDPPKVGHHDYVFDKVNNAGLVFYNEQALNLEGPVMVVEGQVDCIKACRVWPKTVANLTAKPISDKLSKLMQADGVILLLDGDETGRIATKKFMDVLTFMGQKVLPIYLPYDPDTGVKSDPDSLGESWLRLQLFENDLLDKS